MRTIPLICCLPKMSPSSSTSTGSHIATWRWSFTWTRHDFDLISDHRWRKRCSSDHRRCSLNPARHDILPHRQSQLSDLTIRLHNSYNDLFEVYITETVTLSPNSRFDQFNFLINLSTRSCDQSFFVLIGQNRLQLMSVMTIHKYVNVQASVVEPQ